MVNIIITGERLNASSLRERTRKVHPFSPFLFKSYKKIQSTQYSKKNK